ncbi:hypothetical protein [Paenibacillus sp. TH7-28]
MHKYTDGIFLAGVDQRAVDSVFIVTPVWDEDLDFFKPDFHRRYNMGAIGLTPGGDRSALMEWVDHILVKGGEGD